MSYFTSVLRERGVFDIGEVVEAIAGHSDAQSDTVARSVVTRTDKGTAVGLLWRKISKAPELESVGSQLEDFVHITGGTVKYERVSVGASSFGLLKLLLPLAETQGKILPVLKDALRVIDEKHTDFLLLQHTGWWPDFGENDSYVISPRVVHHEGKQLFHASVGPISKFVSPDGYGEREAEYVRNRFSGVPAPMQVSQYLAERILPSEHPESMIEELTQTKITKLRHISAFLFAEEKGYRVCYATHDNAPGLSYRAKMSDGTVWHVGFANDKFTPVALYQRYQDMAQVSLEESEQLSHPSVVEYTFASEPVGEGRHGAKERIY